MGFRCQILTLSSSGLLDQCKIYYFYNYGEDMNLAAHSNPGRDHAKKEMRSSYLPDQKKIAESYQSYFFRSSHEDTDPSPSQSSQTKKNERTKSRFKEARNRHKKYDQLLNDLECTQKSEIQILRQENSELRKAITELKIANFYHVDSEKIKNLIVELEEVKNQLRKIQKQNQNLKLENDFFARANFQLKIQISKLNKNCEGSERENARPTTKLDQILEAMGTRQKRIDESKKPGKDPGYALANSGRPSALEIDDETRMKCSWMDPTKHILNRKEQKSKDLLRVKSQRALVQKRLGSELKNPQRKPIETINIQN